MSAHSPSAFHFQPSSPLETLVRRTSAKRANNLTLKTHQLPPEGSSTHYSPTNDAQNPRHVGSSGQSPVTPPRQTQSPSRPLRPPVSPLLHSHFARDSVGTMDSRYANSYLDLEMDDKPRDSIDSRNIYREGMGFQYDTESVYSTDTALRDSWQSANTVQQSVDGGGSVTGSSRHLSQGARVGAHPQQLDRKPSSSRPPPERQFSEDSTVPTVVVTSDDFEELTPRMDSVQLKHAGKSPVVRPLAPNFSRPMRPSAVPVLMPAEEEKQKVLERNANRRPRQPGHDQSYPSSTHLPSPYSPTSPGDYFSHPNTASTYQQYPQHAQPHPHPHPYPHPRAQSPQYPSSPASRPLTPESYGARSPQGYNTPPGQPGSPSEDYYHQQHQHHTSNTHISPTPSSMARSYPSPSSSRPTSPSAYPTSLAESQQHQRNTSRGMSPSPTPSYQPSTSKPTLQHESASPLNRSPSSKVVLPRRPPSLRPGSPVSLYSRYSYYQLDSPSPNGPTQFNVGDPEKQQHTKSPSSPLGSAMHDKLQTPSGEPETKAHHFLQLGIQHHEANRLKESAVCFEKSAKEDGGCGAGMLMYGLTLRHGWGTEKNEKVGFKWLRKAAESAVVDLESARNGGGIDKGAVRAELILAIYEVGQCFFHGWGVPKDQKMAVSYYRVAARLGDADAQNDLGFCLANGKGCKKDRKEAAKWYRAAVEQGQSDVGLAWIYKEKFQ
ncbi:hypothetical protein V5O48_003460 [Marasmius crinis-equi]|uniref:HCP-like protein n=1 Tax=Marasmius crinis-equi TaxID=585013 RepID=A0ABR3FSS1_9AGAR